MLGKDPGDSLGEETGVPDDLFTGADIPKLRIEG